MATSPQETFVKHWNWLKGEYNSVDLALQEQLAILGDTKASDSSKDKALIDAAKLLCHSLSEVQRRGLFDALIEDVTGNPQLLVLQNELRSFADQLLAIEEKVLLQVGVDPKAAQNLRLALAQVSASAWQAKLLGARDFRKRVDETLKSACKKIPVTYLEMKTMGWVKQAEDIKKRYGLLGGVTLAAANAVAIHTLPEPITATKFSSLVGYIFGGGAT